MQRMFTEDWFYSIFNKEENQIAFFDREIEIRGTFEPSPELRERLKTNEELLEVDLCVETPGFSPCVILCSGTDRDEDEEDIFDDTDSQAAFTALKRIVKERYQMGIVSCWQQRVDQDMPEHRQPTEMEQKRIEQYISQRHSGSPVCKSSRAAVRTLEDLISSIALKLDEQDRCDPILSDFLVCLANLKREILQKGLPTIVDFDMYYEIEVNSAEIAVKLCHVCPLYRFDRLTGLSSREDREYVPTLCTYRPTLYSCQFPLLSCGEFAERCGVEQVTVRQWIRRGKLRSALRIGRDWRIPSTTKRPEEGFTPAIYHLVSAIPEEIKREYPFLMQIFTLGSFCVEESDGGTYQITDSFLNRTRVLAKMTRDEREKFEQMLIEADWVQYDTHPRILEILREPEETQ